MLETLGEQSKLKIFFLWIYFLSSDLKLYKHAYHIIFQWYQSDLKTHPTLINDNSNI